MAKPGNKLRLLTHSCPGNAREVGNSGADRRQTEGSGEVRMRRSLKSSLAPLTNNLVIISFWSQNLDQFSFWSQNLQNQNRLKFTCERRAVHVTGCSFVIPRGTGPGHPRQYSATDGCVSDYTQMLKSERGQRENPATGWPHVCPLLFTSQSAARVTAVSSRVQVGASGGSAFALVVTGQRGMQHSSHLQRVLFSFVLGAQKAEKERE